MTNAYFAAVAPTEEHKLPKGFANSRDRATFSPPQFDQPAHSSLFDDDQDDDRSVYDD